MAAPDTLAFTALAPLLEALSRALTRVEVARALLTLAPPLVGASSALVRLAGPRGDPLFLSTGEDVPALGTPGASCGPHPCAALVHPSVPDASAALGRPGECHPCEEAARRGRAHYLGSPDEVRARYPGLAAAVRAGTCHALACLPLQVEGRTFGVVSFGFPDARAFPEPTRTALHGVVRLCAQALERARLYEEEHRARLHAEAARARLQLLADAGALLSSSPEWERTVDGAARLALGPFADLSVVDLLEYGQLRRWSVLHVDPARAADVEALKRHPLGRLRLFYREALRAGRALLLPCTSAAEVAERLGDAPLAARLAPLGVASCILAPLSARGRALGALCFARGAGRPAYGEEDRALAEELARRVALAIDNARLLRDARDAEEVTRRHAARLRLLAEASGVFAQARLDLPAVLEAVVRCVGSTVGDTCSVRLADTEGAALGEATVYHPDPAAQEALGQALNAAPQARGEGVAGAVLATGQGMRVPVLGGPDVPVLHAPADTPLSTRFPVHSLLAVPLRVEGRVLGVLSAARLAPGRPYSEEDRATAESIADRAALAVENARLYHEAQAAVRLREDFLSVAGHELKTPLTALQLQVQALQRAARHAPEPAPGLNSGVERAVRQMGRLGTLVDELLDVARLTRGRMVLQPEEVDLGALAHELAGRLGEALARARCTLRVQQVASARGVWDRSRLEQVLTNLLANAMKYGAGQPIELQVEGHEGGVRLSVRDRGIGIAPQDQQRIFERFERAVSSKHFGGLGLGLYIVRQIVEAHGGSIAVHSRPGDGATFTVELPREAPPPP